MKLSFKEILMFYHTSLRNVGLYTSISLALLGSSRFYRGKGDQIYNIGFLIISIAILLAAISILCTLLSNMYMARAEIVDEDEKVVIDRMLRVPLGIQYGLGGILGLSVFTVYRQV